jgi:hypothetical protein
LEKNLDFGEDGKDLYDNYVTEKQTRKLIDIYNKKFYTKLSDASVADVYSWYTSALANISKEQKALVDGIFAKFSGENYGQLQKKISILNKKLELLEAEGKEEEMKKIQQELEQYTGFVLADNMINKYNYENLRYQAVEASKPYSFGGLEQALMKTEAETPRK